MEQQSPVDHLSQTLLQNKNQSDFQEGEIVQSKPQIQKPQIRKQNKCQIDGSDSEWSWQSIEDFKGVNLKQLQIEEQDEVKIESKPKIKVIYPQKPGNLQKLITKYAGNIIHLVGDLLIVQADLKQTYEVIDLDGWVCDQNKNFIGFVIDVFGKIQSPFYAIKSEQHLQNLKKFIGQTIHYAEGTKILNKDQIRSIQSKNNKEFEAQQLSSSSDYEKQEKQCPFETPQIYQQRKQSNNFIQNRQQRKSFSDHSERCNDRSRTRQNKKNRNWNNRKNNQQYLQNMYTTHYNQMMQFYNPNYQANTAAFSIPQFNPQSISLSAFGNLPPPSNFVPGNIPPQFPPLSQQPKPNFFMPSNNYQHPKNFQNWSHGNSNTK